MKIFQLTEDEIEVLQYLLTDEGELLEEYMKDSENEDLLNISNERTLQARDSLLVKFDCLIDK